MPGNANPGLVFDQPRRLWNLWDMARPFHVWAFLTARGFLINYHSYGLFNRLYAALHPLLPWLKPDSSISDKDREVYRGAWSSIRQEFVDLELVASVASIDRMLAYLNDPKAEYEKYWSMGQELEGRLLDEVRNRQFLSLTMRETEFYRNPLNQWDAIVERFPEAIGDVEEAYRCLALSRYAAAVFHSLQVMEFGLIAIGKLVGSTDPLAGWPATTNALEAITKKKHQDRTDFEKAHFAFFEQVHASVVALKNAWRNKVSHAHGKLTLLTADFSPDVAEEILFATRAFMRRLATDAPSPPS